MQLLAALATLASLGLAAARSSSSRLAIDQIEYGFCPGSPQPGSIDSIVVKPFPISLKEGSSLALSAQVTLKEEIPAGATITLDLKKEGAISIPIPCLDVEGTNIGSWSHSDNIIHSYNKFCSKYTADELLAAFSSVLCPD